MQNETIRRYIRTNDARLWDLLSGLPPREQFVWRLLADYDDRYFAHPHLFVKAEPRSLVAIEKTFGDKASLWPDLPPQYYQMEPDPVEDCYELCGDRANRARMYWTRPAAQDSLRVALFQNHDFHRYTVGIGASVDARIPLQIIPRKWFTSASPVEFRERFPALEQLIEAATWCFQLFDYNEYCSYFFMLARRGADAEIQDLRNRLVADQLHTFAIPTP